MPWTIQDSSNSKTTWERVSGRRLKLKGYGISGPFCYGVCGVGVHAHGKMIAVALGCADNKNSFVEVGCFEPVPVELFQSEFVYL